MTAKRRNYRPGITGRPTWSELRDLRSLAGGLGGEVEVDETFTDRKIRTMHKNREKSAQRTGLFGLANACG